MDCLLRLFLVISICRGLFCSENAIEVSKNETTCLTQSLPCFGIKEDSSCSQTDMTCDKKSECNRKRNKFYCFNNTYDLNITVKCSIEQDVGLNCRKQNDSLCSLHINYIEMLKEKVQKNQVFREFKVYPKGFDLFNNYNSSLTVEGISLINGSLFENFYFLTSVTIRKTCLTNITDNLFPSERFLNLCRIEITENDFLTTIHVNKINNSRVKILNISLNALTNLVGTFENLQFLEIVDLRGNKILLTSNLFEKNNNLTYIYADSYSFCCLKPKSMPSDNCVTPAKTDVTNCDLIEDRVLRLSLWIIGIMAVIGNLVVIVYHLVRRNSFNTQTFSIFVMNLSMSDAMMGLYMLIIGIHDILYRDTYVYEEDEWKKSLLCKMTGAMSFVSSESSVIFIFFITLDRLLAIKYTLSGWRITAKRAYVIIFLSWLISFFSAALPGKLYEGFYSRSGVCIALPLTGGIKEGRFQYSASTFLGFNFVVFLFIAVGQYLIFREIKQSSKRVGRPLSSRDRSVAKLLLLIAITDCLCWLPIGILVILAICGVTIPIEMYAWVVVFIMPGNSAINPFLYTFVPAFLKYKREKRRTSVIKTPNPTKSKTKLSCVKMTEMKESTV